MSKNPLATLKHAEQTLVDGINRASDLVDEVGTARVDESMARFEASVEAAKERLQAAAQRVQALADDLLSCLFGEVGVIDADIQANAVPALPAPAANAETEALRLAAHLEDEPECDEPIIVTVSEPTPPPAASEPASTEQQPAAGLRCHQCGVEIEPGRGIYCPFCLETSEPPTTTPAPAKPRGGRGRTKKIA